MDADLTLPGSIPGLLRRGSPCIRWVGFGGREPEALFGVVLRRLADDEAGERWLCWFDDERIGKDVGFAPHLDLADDTGKTHAAWWLLATIPARSYRYRFNAEVRLGTMFGSASKPPVVYLTIGDSYCGGLVFASRAVHHPSYLATATVIPALGIYARSRDEQAPLRALRAVVLHVANLPTEG